MLIENESDKCKHPLMELNSGDGYGTHQLYGCSKCGRVYFDTWTEPDSQNDSCFY